MDTNDELTNALAEFDKWYRYAWNQPLPPLDESVRRTRAWCAFKAGWAAGARFVIENEKKGNEDSK